MVVTAQVWWVAAVHDGWRMKLRVDVDTSLFHARIQSVYLLPYAYTPVDFMLREKNLGSVSRLNWLVTFYF